MPIWNAPPGSLDPAQVQTACEDAIDAKNVTLTQYAKNGSVLGIADALANLQIPSKTDVTDLRQVVTGLQTIEFYVTAPTTNQALLAPFVGTHYGIWRVLISNAVTLGDVQLVDDTGGLIWNYVHTLGIGSTLSLGSDGDALWESASGKGVNLQKTAGSTVHIQLWWQYLTG